MDKESLFRAFKIAMDREYEAKNFYTDIAEQVDEKELRELFESFAAEEKKHLEKLQTLYRTMKEKS